MMHMIAFGETWGYHSACSFNKTVSIEEQHRYQHNVDDIQGEFAVRGGILDVHSYKVVKRT